MFIRKHELAGIFSLHDFVAWKAAIVERTETLSIVTPAAEWAYAVALPRKNGPDAVAAGFYLVEVDITVTVGRVSVGCLTMDEKSFLAESIQTWEEGSTTVSLRLDSLEDCGWLMVRNGDAGNKPSAATLSSVRVFHVTEAPDRPIYVFDHIFKTGGTTFLQSCLRAAFRENERLILRPLLPGNAEDRRCLQALSYEERRKLYAVGGHNGGLLRSALEGARFLTLVREPVARVISAYRHARFHSDSRPIIGAYMEKENISLKKFVEADLFAGRTEPFLSVHDWQAKTLLGESFSAVRLDENAVVQAIRERFWLVGYTEALELFVFYLHWVAGFPLVLFNNRLVQGSRELQANSEDVETIRRLNAADVVVYGEARKEFDRRVAAIWNEEIERDYCWYLERLHLFRRASGGDSNSMRLLRLCPSQRQAETPPSGDGLARLGHE